MKNPIHEEQMARLNPYDARTSDIQKVYAEQWEARVNQNEFTRAREYLSLAKDEFIINQYDPIRNELEKLLEGFQTAYEEKLAELLKKPIVGYVPDELAR